jgi:hypothetical protein
VANFATSFTSVVDTSDKFATGVNHTVDPAANNGENIKLLRSQSELEGKNISIS